MKHLKLIFSYKTKLSSQDSMNVKCTLFKNMSKNLSPNQKFTVFRKCFTIRFYCTSRIPSSSSVVGESKQNIMPVLLNSSSRKQTKEKINGFDKKLIDKCLHEAKMCRLQRKKFNYFLNYYFCLCFTIPIQPSSKCSDPAIGNSKLILPSFNWSNYNRFY